jgi:hypothetical protein
MLSTLRASRKPGLRGGALALALGMALGGCRVSTDLADATQNGAGGDDGTSAQGGAQSPGSGGAGAPSTGGSSSEVGGTGGTSSEVGGTGGTSSDVGGTGGTSSEVGGTGGTGGANPAGGSGGECWNPTVNNYCSHFECPPSAQAPSWPSEDEIRQYYEDNGTCDVQTVTTDIDECGGVMIGYDDGTSAESYLIISGTLGATAISRDAPFGPCNQTYYYSGIEADEWYAMCPLLTRCIVCGPPLPEQPEYPPCRFDCDCQNIEPGPDPCFGADSCECYCERARVH